MNMQEKFVVVLEARGFVIVKRGKYIVMGHEGFVAKSGKPKFFYVGKSGALRVGINQASSIAMSDLFKSRKLKEYDNLMPPGF